MTSYLRIFFLVFAISGCASLTGKILKDPEVFLNGVEVTDFSVKSISLNLRLIVRNPNSIPLKLNQINYSLKVANQLVSEGLFENGINVPAQGEGEVVVPLKLKFQTLGAIFDGLVSRSLNRDYEVKGSANIGIFSIPFSKKGEIKFEDSGH